MTTIWKYPLKLTDEQVVRMPEGGEILTAQMQGGTLCLWVLVNNEAPAQGRTIEVRGTGHPAPNGCRYIATTQMGQLVWHVFEREIA